MEYLRVKPFLKWAGSKYKIIDRVLDALPNGDQLIEPFAGSGAVFLNAEFDGYLIADTNADLINLFIEIQTEGREFITYASSLFLAENNTEEAYYRFREEFNDCSDIPRKSALFIYLNRHCFNGLCRYNSKGGFNVPFGRCAKPAFPEKEILNFYEKSKRAVFEIADFKSTMNKATNGSVVYCDPPYAPLTVTANFSNYTSSGFNDEDQKALADSAKILTLNGIPVVISNHDTEFTRLIYEDANILSFDVQRFISSDAKNRNKAPELMACYKSTNYFNIMDKNFKKLTSTFKSSIKTWDYFVNWEKVFSNKYELEITLNTLNYLLGKENLREEFDRLYISNPEIIKTFPILLAVRENKIEVFDKCTKNSEFFDFTRNELDAEKYFRFLQYSGLEKLFKKDGIKNLVDYVMGIEVGLDSNGRKNRGGSLMEEIVDEIVANFCTRRGFEYIAQAKSSTIKSKWNIEVNINKSERSFDFAVFNPKNRSIKLFETNFYNGGGSKLKSVCGEFRTLYNELKAQNIDFVWITDGLGWNTAARPLEETYNHNDYVFNLSMLESGILDELMW
jgi:DNA adenine methylase